VLVLARVTAACVCAILTATPLARSQQPQAREHFTNADVLYDWASNSRGDKLRLL
jgi:hypothetical protein